MNKNIIISIVLGLLVIISVVQAFQLSSIKSELSGSSIGSVPASGGASSGGAAPQLPSSLNNLPTMVGGC